MAHVLEAYVKKTDGAKFTGDRTRFLMLSLPLVVHDLVAPEVYPCLHLIFHMPCINNGIYVSYEMLNAHIIF
jgi:hypothetical protein